MFSLRGWNWLVAGGLVGSIMAAPAPAAVITPAPNADVDFWKRQGPDAASFAQVLLTAIPPSLRQLAATNAPAVSSILWEEFLDDKRPQWFLALPFDIQSYLVREFGPKTASFPTPPQTTGAQTTPSQSNWKWPQSTKGWQSPQAKPSVSYTVPNSAAGTSAVSTSNRPSAIVSSVVTFSTLTRSSPSASRSSSASVSSPAIVSNQASTRSASASSIPTASPEPASPPASNEGLTRTQKIGLGVGLPLGVFGAAALLLGCCFLLRRRKNKDEAGSVPPSSPGFIPRFAFQDKSTGHFDHRTPLNPNMMEAGRDHGTMNWDDEGYDPYESTAYDPAPLDMSHQGNAYPPIAPSPPMSMQDTQPIMAPALYHTHSSNRARGKRTSYSSLHAVAEMSEPDDNIESPVLGRHHTPSQRNRRPSMPPVLEIPAVPLAATIKRKPVGESPTAMSPAAGAASLSLLRPPIRNFDHSGSSSSGLALSTDSSIAAGNHTDPTSPISPLSQHAPANPFKTDYSYVEDYGPEYQTGYIDHEDGLYGGNRSLDRYPDPSPPRRSSKTDWPLRNISLGHRRNRSPMWDRVYEN
ncbi:hypothetical protein DE146DRAFT_505254 [Phaeosphaeria sp. MPI-PUGE-AT-0046c]|nr:hypothetical protein DE146DRAFT_505254 [Phaeosphaeria sp. MPI-PUGE-AT-0046c]